MTKLELTKTVVNVVVGLGTTKIVADVVKNNTNPESVTDKVTVTAGSVALGGMAADASRNYTSAKIDEIANWWNVNVKKN